MISLDQNQQGLHAVSKFTTKFNEEISGRLLALNMDSNMGIMLSMEASEDGDAKFGRFYIVEEIEDAEFPRIVEEVSHIPGNGKWGIISTSHNKDGKHTETSVSFGGNRKS